MLDDAARVDRYQSQTGRTRLTPRQHRRINHKRRHQSVAAGQVREARSAERVAAATARREAQTLAP
jgi:hypothetical protein